MYSTLWLHVSTTNAIKLSHSCKIRSLSYSSKSGVVPYQCTKPKLIYGGRAQSNEPVSIRSKYTVHNTQEDSSLLSESPSTCMQIPSFQLMLKAFLKVNFWNHQQLLHYTVFNCFHALWCYIIKLSFKFKEQQKVIRSHIWCQGRVS